MSFHIPESALLWITVRKIKQQFSAYKHITYLHTYIFCMSFSIRDNVWRKCFHDVDRASIDGHRHGLCLSITARIPRLFRWGNTAWTIFLQWIQCFTVIFPGNPFNCDCNMKWMHHGKDVFMDYLLGVDCANVNGTNFWDLDASFFYGC